MKVRVLLGISAILISTAAEAGPVPTAYVIVEDDDAQNVACNASMASSGDAVKAALRYSGTTITQQSNDLRATKVWITTNAMEIDRINCAVSYHIQFYRNQSFEGPSGEPFFWPR